MKWLTKSGKVKDIKGIHQYKVDWDDDQGSRFSEEVLDLLHPYWKGHIVFAELPVVGGTKGMRYDYVNVTRKIIIETDGRQHGAFVKHFHGHPLNYGSQIGRDLLKDELAEKNGFHMVRIKPSDLPALRADIKEWFLKTHDITL